MAKRYGDSDTYNSAMQTVGDRLIYEAIVDQIERLENQGEDEVRIEYLERVTGLGYLTICETVERLAGESGPSPENLPPLRFNSDTGLLIIESESSTFSYRSDLEERAAHTGEYCPQCEARLSHQGGCRTCRRCGWEECYV